ALHRALGAAAWTKTTRTRWSSKATKCAWSPSLWETFRERCARSFPSTSASVSDESCGVSKEGKGRIDPRRCSYDVRATWRQATVDEPRDEQGCAALQGFSETGATGLQPATSGVTGRIRSRVMRRRATVKHPHLLALLSSSRTSAACLSHS